MSGFSRTSLVPLIVAFAAFGIVTSPATETQVDAGRGNSVLVFALP